ncbi:uncharacterized protein BP01DRAFT_400383 [Aspergillus saccharolyticus JOP 1030-1]|uniref:Aminoglycoside phosphotransferase domain-containing protein n=1 Tax=Aspergillus saccharolyticus JOP 1030-1 TaxID=1450539 RepID=A0A318ZNF0_9EURO|nr:hypothetical protein BP01DRAFT_400383 [Aspergillus saccharolyticus JOP 1030-1]PYH49141.1 hypothetical protein BP01DRAFT_400383 [Aspergillus saccharolyticus JOP 1030-1]
MEEFHRNIRMGIDFDPDQEAVAQGLIKMYQTKTWPLVLTPGDLNSLNILVRDDNIVGIIDWETGRLVSGILRVHICPSSLPTKSFLLPWDSQIFHVSITLTSLELRLSY